MAAAIPLIVRPNLAEQVDALERDGYAYLPGVLSPDEIEVLRAAMDRVGPISESYDTLRTLEEHGASEKNINNIFNRDPVFLPYLDHPGVIEIAETVHSDDCHIMAMHAYLTGPGRAEQPLHADYLPVELPEDVLADPRVKVPVFITTTIFYLDDIYRELGPTELVPGSHRAGRQPSGDVHWKGIQPQAVLCRAGDAVIFRSDIWHRGTANRTDQVRYLLMVHYANRMVSQKFPPHLSFQFDPDILGRATPRQRRLLGEHRQSSYE